MEPHQEHHLLQEIVRVGQEKFPAKQQVYWQNKETLKKALQDELVTRFGITIAENGNSFVCGRGMNPKHNTPAYKKQKLAQHEHDYPTAMDETNKKKRSVLSLRCGCTFRIRYTKASAMMPSAPPEAVRITEASFLHTNGCQPSIGQMNVMRKRNGHFTVQLSKQKMWEIIQLLNAGHVPSKILRWMLQQILPQSVVVDSQFLTNVRLKAKRLGPTCPVESIDISPDTIQQLTSSTITRGEDANDTSHFLDLATKHAREILQEALASDETKWKVQVYMEKLSTKDPGFSYHIARAADGSPTGVVWMTPAMRSAFESFGECIFLDAMKRQQNSLHWPYIAMVVLDGDKKIFVACESISCAERIETYTWICDFVFTHAPQRQRKDVLMIFSDCFVTDSLLESLGIQNTCNLGWDAYHLFQEDWPSYFGNSLWPLVVDSMRKMLFGFSEAEYLEGYTSAITSMRNHENRYTEYIQKWHRNRDKFAKYIVSHQAGSLRRHGSSHAEQNHSSFVQRIGPICLDDPATAISTMLRRHADICSERNHQITRYHLSVASRVQTMNTIDSTDIKAINFLSSWGFELWQEMRSEARNYQVEHVSAEISHVTRIGICPPVVPRILLNGTQCNCQHKMALHIQCPHKTAVANGEFLPHLWNQRRWQQRPYLILSNIPPKNQGPQEGEEQVLELPPTSICEQTRILHNNGDAAIETPSPEEGDTMMPTTQDSFMRGATDDNPTIDDNDEFIPGTDSRVDDEQFSTHQRVAQTSISFAMLKRVACELVEVTMKLNNEPK